MTKKAFSQYVPSFDSANDLQACIDEVFREIATRKRLYDRWVAEGKVTFQEAHDRMTRLLGAHQFLLQHVPDDAKLKVNGNAGAEEPKPF